MCWQVVLMPYNDTVCFMISALHYVCFLKIQLQTTHEYTPMQMDVLYNVYFLFSFFPILLILGFNFFS